MIELFEIDAGKIILTKHCYSLKSLKAVIDEYPHWDDHEKIFRYLFYMTCPDPKRNPFFNIPDDIKEEMILKEMGANFSLDSTSIPNALKFCNKLYETPMKRGFLAQKRLVDKFVTYVETVEIKEAKEGEEGNVDLLVNIGIKMDKMMQGYRNSYIDFVDEQKKERARGDAFIAYDQK